MQVNNSDGNNPAGTPGSKHHRQDKALATATATATATPNVAAKAASGGLTPDAGSLPNNPASALDRGGDDDDWHSRSWDLFLRYAQRGVIDVEAFVHIANDLNVDCDQFLLKRMLPEHEWDNISYNTVMKTLEAIPSFIVEEEEDRALVDTDSAHARYVNPFEYLWREVMCGEKEEGIEYFVHTKYKPSPSFWLVFNASIVFIAVGAGIITMLSLLWLDNEMSRERNQLANFGESLSYFANSVGNALLRVNADDLKDQVVTLSRWMEQRWTLHQEEMRVQLGIEAAMHMGLLHKLGAASIQSCITQLTQQLDAASAISGSIAPLTAAALGELVQKWIHKWQDRFSSSSSTGELTMGIWEAAIYAPHTDAFTFTSGKFNETWLKLPMTNAPTTSTATEEERRRCPCVGLFRNMKSDKLEDTHTLDGQKGTVIARYYRGAKVGICFSISEAAQAFVAQHQIRLSIDKANAYATKLVAAKQQTRKEMTMSHEFLVRSDATGKQHRTFGITTRKSITAPICGGTFADEDRFDESFGRFQHQEHENGGMTSFPTECFNFTTTLMHCYVTQCELYGTTQRYYSSDPALLTIGYIKSARAVFTLGVLENAMLQDFQESLIDTANALNSGFARSTEVVLSIRDNIGRIVPQATNYRFTDSCLIQCQRIPEAVSTMIDAFRYHESGTSLYPDYTLRPVLGAYSYMLGGIEVALTIERDLPELRSDTVDAIISAVGKMNSRAIGSVEVQIAQRDGMPRITAFNPNDLNCPKNVLCMVDPEYGVVFRSDCVHCLRMPQLNETNVAYLTELRFADRCPASYHCNVSRLVQLDADNSILKEELRTLNDVTHGVQGTDYSGVEVVGAATYIENYSTVLLVKKDLEEVRGPVLESIAVISGISGVVVVLGVVGLVVLSNRTLRKIEIEWLEYKTRIETEKTKFDSMIREIIPSAVFTKFQRGQRTVTDTFSSLSFGTIDICGFSELTKQMSAKHVVRMITYYFAVYETVAAKFSVFRLRNFGDVAVYVAGNNEAKSGQVATWSVGCFIAYLMQILSSQYSHFPQRLSMLADVYRHEKVDLLVPAVMPAVRIGAHSGPAVSGLVDTGKTPFYEIYGASMALCHRMQSTAPPGRVHVSAPFKELLEASDTENAFEFDTVRKTVVKGRTVVASYTIKSVQMVLDEVLLSSLKIEPAQQMYKYATVGTRDTDMYFDDKQSSHRSSATKDSDVSSS